MHRFSLLLAAGLFSAGLVFGAAPLAAVPAPAAPEKIAMAVTFAAQELQASLAADAPGTAKAGKGVLPVPGSSGGSAVFAYESAPVGATRAYDGSTVFSAFGLFEGADACVLDGTLRTVLSLSGSDATLTSKGSLSVSFGGQASIVEVLVTTLVSYDSAARTYSYATTGSVGGQSVDYRLAGGDGA